MTLLNISNWNWELILAAIGALAWAPWVIDKLTPSKIYGNLLSQLLNSGEFNANGENKIGILHFFKISITCLNKNFNIKSITINVKYKEDDKWYKGEIYWARTSVWTMPGNTEKKSLTIPHTEFLGFTNVLEKDKSKFYYLTFITNKKELTEYETVRLTFTDFKEKRQEVNFISDEIDSNKILWEDNIWE
jgi:hypothetical protein